MSKLVDKLKGAYRNENKYRHDRIYDVDENIIGKRYNSEAQAKHEFELGKYLKSKDLNVPKMHRMAYLGFNSGKDNHYYFWFVLMEKIKGQRISDIFDEERNKVYRQYREQIGKVLDLGIMPKDADWGSNSIYNSLENKLYLIDFEEWVINGNPSEIKQEYDRINSPYLCFRHSSM